MPQPFATNLTSEAPLDLVDADTAAYRAFARTSYLPGLDGLRALSVVPVVGHHFSGVYGRDGFGWASDLGVQTFFLISGFLITTLALRERSQTGRFSWPRFMARRALRIFPLYYAVLALHFVWLALIAAPTPAASAFRTRLWAFATYTSNWTSVSGQSYPFQFSWSLSAEEQFYLAWSICLALVAHRSLALWALAALGTVFLVAFQSASDWLAFTLINSFVGLFVGALLAIALPSRRAFSFLRRSLSSRWALAFGSLAIALGLRGHGVGARVVALAGLALCFGVVVLACPAPIERLLRSQPLVFVGRISYGVYMLHIFAVHVVLSASRRMAIEDAYWPLFAATLALSIGVAKVSYVWFERPFLRLKDRFRTSASSAKIEPVVAGAGVIR